MPVLISHNINNIIITIENIEFEDRMFKLTFNNSNNNESFFVISNKYNELYDILNILINSYN